MYDQNIHAGVFTPFYTSVNEQNERASNPVPNPNSSYRRMGITNLRQVTSQRHTYRADSDQRRLEPMVGSP